MFEPLSAVSPEPLPVIVPAKVVALSEPEKLTVLTYAEPFHCATAKYPVAVFVPPVIILLFALVP